MRHLQLFGGFHYVHLVRKVHPDSILFLNFVIFIIDLIFNITHHIPSTSFNLLYPALLTGSLAPVVSNTKCPSFS